MFVTPNSSQTWNCPELYSALFCLSYLATVAALFTLMLARLHFKHFTAYVSENICTYCIYIGSQWCIHRNICFSENNLVGTNKVELVPHLVAFIYSAWYILYKIIFIVVYSTVPFSWLTLWHTDVNCDATAQLDIQCAYPCHWVVLTFTADIPRWTRGSYWTQETSSLRA